MKWVARIKFNNVNSLRKAAQAAFAINQTPQEVHNQLMGIHWYDYVKLKEEDDLEFALEHLTAYFHQGYKFNEVNSVSEDIAKAAGYKSLIDYLGCIHYKYNIEHSRSFSNYAIKENLGYGFASESRLGVTQNDIINEISFNISNHKIGTYCYVLHDKEGYKTYVSFLIITNKKIYMQNNFGDSYKLSNIPTIYKSDENSKKIYNIGESYLNSPNFINYLVRSILRNEFNEEIHKDFIRIYWRFYDKLENEIYLKLALEHIAVYVNSRFKITDLDDSLTAKILAAAGYNSINDFLYAYLNKEKFHYVHLSRNKIDHILGVGSAREMTRKEIIDDIIAKVLSCEIGTYFYSIFNNKKEERIFKLTTEGEKSYMKDDLNNIFVFINN